LTRGPVAPRWRCHRPRCPEVGQEAGEPASHRFTLHRLRRQHRTLGQEVSASATILVGLKIAGEIELLQACQVRFDASASLGVATRLILLLQPRGNQTFAFLGSGLEASQDALRCPNHELIDLAGLDPRHRLDLDNGAGGIAGTRCRTPDAQELSLSHAQ
jgi:hypothetical protein